MYSTSSFYTFHFESESGSVIRFLITDPDSSNSPGSIGTENLAEAIGNAIAVELSASPFMPGDHELVSIIHTHDETIEDTLYPE